MRDSKLNAEFLRNEDGHVITSHTRLWRQESWVQRRGIGSGNYGIVRLESRLEGDNSDGRTFRAVKEIPKDRSNSDTIEYVRELEALAKFSQDKVNSAPSINTMSSE